MTKQPRKKNETAWHRVAADRQRADRNYAKMVAMLRHGRWFPAERILAVCQWAGRTAAEFIIDVFAPPTGPRKGDPCPKAGCDGQLRVGSSRAAGDQQVQHLVYCICKTRGGKQVVPTETIRRRGRPES